MTTGIDRYEQYRRLQELHARNCVCPSDMEIAWLHIQSTGPRRQLAGWKSMQEHDYERCFQHMYPRWFWALRQDLVTDDKAAFDTHRQRILHNIRAVAHDRYLSAKWHLDAVISELDEPEPPVSREEEGFDR